jgi:CO/xanthine dehydrogenase Mo-binding subunit
MTVARAGASPLAQLRSVDPPDPAGRSVPRRDGVAKVTGTARFTADHDLPGLCHARVLRSPHAHARITAIRTDEAAHMPGVVAIVTATSLERLQLYYGHAVTDHPLIAVERVRFAGEPVVGVVAEDVMAADQALEAVEVDYDPLPYVTDQMDALRDDAPIIHQQPGASGAHRGFEEATGERPPNVCSASDHGWGNVADAFDRADLVVEGQYEYPMAYAYAMEPYVAIARFSEGSLTVWASAQHPFMVRSDLARCFGLPLSAVQVSVPYVGGGYGSKSYTKIEPLVAALSYASGRPVRLALSVEEAILTTRSVSARMDVRTALTRDGLILARQGRLYLNSGAYAENSPRVANKAARRLAGPYRIPALDVRSWAIYTNTAPGSSYRGLGGPQAVFAGESQLDEAAERLGIDPLALRRRNLLRRGESPWPGARPLDADLHADLDIVAQRLGYGTPLPPHRGRAICVSASDGGAEPTSSAVARLHADGSVTLLCGSAEMGQGSSTVLPQIAAAELGMPLERVTFVNSDTGVVSYDRSTGASRTTTVMGLAIQRAADDIRAQLAGWARDLHGDAVGATERSGMRVGDELMSWDRIVRDWYGGAGGEVIGRGYVRGDGPTRELPLFWEVGCLGVEVDVDHETGIIRVERLVTLGDVGCAINPQLAEGQDLGGAIMGMGVALREELRYEEQSLANGNLWDYRVPRASDVPEVDSLLAERGDGIGPYGAKGGGEAAVNPIGPAIAGAVAQATGVRFRRLPLSPERVWRALRDRAADIRSAGSAPGPE